MTIDLKAVADAARAAKLDDPTGESAETIILVQCERPRRKELKLAPGLVIFWEEDADEVSRAEDIVSWALIHAIVDGRPFESVHPFATLTVKAVRSFEWANKQGWVEQHPVDTDDCDFFAVLNEHGSWDPEFKGNSPSDALDQVLVCLNGEPERGFVAEIVCGKYGEAKMVLTDADGVPTYRAVS
jgi:hypothetical protein